MAARNVGQDGQNSNVQNNKIDNELDYRSKHHSPSAKTPVIVELRDGAQLPAEFKQFAKRNHKNGNLDIIHGHVIEVPNGLLKRLAAHPDIFKIRYDRETAKENYRTSLTVGSRVVENALGLTGAGIGVAVIDSGISTWHDDMTNRSTTLYPYGDQRVTAFVDFVNGRTAPYDDEGHGTHVAGIIAGNGYDSNGQKAGAAPDASLVVLKVLDANGTGRISNIIAALDWVLANHTAYNIRVVSMSVGAGVYESYWTDPLTLATKRLVDAGVVVVSAAGNLGKNHAGLPQWGGITAPGNAPWVLTVGASSTMGTPTRVDDTMAGYSSRGPTYRDWEAKPDLVAPGTGTVSLADPTSTFYTTKAPYLLPGSISTAYLPYLSLSGTSMATPVVSGTVALMLQANPNLTPNAVKAILQYTAQTYAGYKPLEQGAGFLNVIGALRLARFYATAQPGQPYPSQAMWSKHIIWGNHMLTGGILSPTGTAWTVGTTWGAAKTGAGAPITWGVECGTCDNIVWGTAALDNIVWGTAAPDNIVWGTAGLLDIVWGTSGVINIVWGTAAGDDNIVWGTDCAGADCDNIVWGTVDPLDNIVWGTAEPGDNIVWGTAGLEPDNIVWGTADDDNIVWGTADGDNIVWGTAAATTTVWITATDGTVIPVTSADVFDALTDEQLFGLAPYTPPAPQLQYAPTPDPLAPAPTSVVETTAPATTTVAPTTTTVAPTTTTVDPTTTTVVPTTTTTTNLLGGFY